MEMLQKLFFIFKFPNTILFLKLIEKYLWKPCEKVLQCFFFFFLKYKQMNKFQLLHFGIICNYFSFPPLSLSYYFFFLSVVYV